MNASSPLWITSPPIKTAHAGELSGFGAVLSSFLKFSVSMRSSASITKEPRQVVRIGHFLGAMPFATSALNFAFSFWNLLSSDHSEICSPKNIASPETASANKINSNSFNIQTPNSEIILPQIP